MKNIIDYAENSMETFEERVFSTADSVILSWLAYFRFPMSIKELSTWKGLRLGELFRTEFFTEMLTCPGGYEANRKLLTAICASPRFRDMYVCAFRDEKDFKEEKEFSAINFYIEDAFCYVAYRGTDTTFLGWKEDFNMSFQYPVPSQTEACAYLEMSAMNHRGKIYVGGHSKGGNLAVYAALNATYEVQERIEKVYSHDGPGFPKEVLLDNRFKLLDGKLEKTIPQSSVIGLLMEDQCPVKIIKSKGLSVWQHNAYMWEMKENDFIEEDRLTIDARFLDKTLHQWLTEMPLNEREEFIKIIYEIVNKGDVKTFRELKENWRKALPQMAGALKHLDMESRSLVGKTFKKLGTTAVDNLPSLPNIPNLPNLPELPSLPKLDTAGGKAKIKQKYNELLKGKESK